MSLHPGQKRVVAMLDKHREVVCICGRGWGKSHLAVELVGAYMDSVREPGWYVWWVAKQSKQAKMIAWERLYHRWKDALSGFNRQEGWMRTRWGTVVEFVGTDVDPDAVRGRNVVFCVWDEPYVCQFGFMDAVVRPALRHPKSRLLLIGTVPDVESPDFDPGWLRYIEAAEDESRLYVGTSRENEGFGLPRGWTQENLERARKIGTEAVARREYLCEFETKGMGASLNLSELRVEKLPPEGAWFYRALALDPHPTRPTALVAAEITVRGIYFTHAMYVEHPIHNVVGRIRALERDRGAFTHMFIDPAMGRARWKLVGFPSLADWFRTHGLRFQFAQPDRTLFLARLQDLVKRRAIFFCPEAEALVKQLEVYKFVETRGKYKSRVQDDLVDCMRYIVNAGLDRFIARILPSVRHTFVYDRSVEV